MIFWILFYFIFKNENLTILKNITLKMSQPDPWAHDQGWGKAKRKWVRSKLKNT
jgi:hypothetical protein